MDSISFILYHTLVLGVCFGKNGIYWLQNLLYFYRMNLKVKTNSKCAQEIPISFHRVETRTRLK